MKYTFGLLPLYFSYYIPAITGVINYYIIVCVIYVIICWNSNNHGQDSKEILPVIYAPSNNIHIHIMCIVYVYFYMKIDNRYSNNTTYTIRTRISYNYHRY